MRAAEKRRACAHKILASLVVLVSVLAWSNAHAETKPTPTAVLLLKTSSAQSTSASFGRGAMQGPAGRALREPFESLGIRFVSASGVAVHAGDPEHGLPLSNSAAVGMARESGASICVVAGITTQAKGKVRATQLQAHEARLRIRVIDTATGTVVADSSSGRFGYAQDAEQAAAAAQSASIANLDQGIINKVRARWPSPSAASAAALTLTIGGAQGWRPVASILKQLAASKGIKFVHALEIQSSQVKLSVSSTMSAASLVAMLQRTRIHNGSISVVSSGNSITMQVQALPSSTTLNNG